MRIAVLGAGMVGRAIALDLQEKHAVSSFDIDESNLDALHTMNDRIELKKTDLREYDNYHTLLAPFDYVVTAVPGHLGYPCLEAVINAGKSAADISFFPENPLALDSVSKKMGVTIITDAGVAPGMSNYILGYCNSIMKVDHFECYVGGLPQHPVPPFFYKAPFSPLDVIEEYTRPARLKEKGRVVEKDALTDRAIMTFDETGPLEAFNTDGLRTLLFTMPHIPDMKEQTLRYPGHLDLILSLKQAGFFSDRAVQFRNQLIRPIDFSAGILIDQWKTNPTDKDITIMKVLVSGELDEKKGEIEYYLYDEFDPATRLSSMSRTTGFTCTASLELIMQGMFKGPGVFPPELVGKDSGCFSFLLNYLKERGVNWKIKKSIGDSNFY